MEDCRTSKHRVCRALVCQLNPKIPDSAPPLHVGAGECRVSQAWGQAVHWPLGGTLPPIPPLHPQTTATCAVKATDTNTLSHPASGHGSQTGPAGL